MPQGECGPIGDNTSYGRRVFAAAYLLCIGESRDAPALWTFDKYTDRNRLDPILAFLWYPDELKSVSPGPRPAYLLLLRDHPQPSGLFLQPFRLGQRTLCVLRFRYPV